MDAGPGPGRAGLFAAGPLSPVPLSAYPAFRMPGAGNNLIEAAREHRRHIPWEKKA
ncbi:hypothetical protein MVG78_06750 [Roseomonas gilardii subsp. gilardii]|uniref:hypothetical protein n=1 Tax=Roseomonas gilardii TaxID=257708 RepID=UPI001FF96132|nr:hypothetical protein [Roseomonas gilardii]UPG73827.1 hypothetical protein MVG78_06750 [Roseomonas gilardii subsp. gilardii]